MIYGPVEDRLSLYLTSSFPSWTSLATQLVRSAFRRGGNAHKTAFLRRT